VQGTPALHTEICERTVIGMQLLSDHDAERRLEYDSKSADGSRVGSIPILGTNLKFAVLFDPRRLPEIVGKRGN
jgi:hypothetical protein